MSEKTGIEWTDHTFNPWWGCTKVSPACASCYAEEWAGRFPKTQGLWGPDAPRKIASEKVWHDPIRWDKKAREDGVRRRVFCASMSDVFEDRRDLDAARKRLARLIILTPHLDWQLLTKRPEHVLRLAKAADMLLHDGDKFLPNVWVGCTVENQEEAEKRIPHLLAIPARVRFLSCEPLLGAVDLAPWLGGWEKKSGISWVIVGGESGSSPRPMHPEWARSLRDQCAGVLVPFFFKQWGEWAPSAGPGLLRTLEGGPEVCRVGKKAAGSLLDGVNHKAFPVPS